MSLIDFTLFKTTCGKVINFVLAFVFGSKITVWLVVLLGAFGFYGRAAKSVKALVFVGGFPLPSNNKIIQIGHVTVGHRFAIIATVTLPFNINVRCLR
ncbi:hypothetical protein D1094_18310 [Colwellia sp. RSH04]|nr:hypothetical protein D1094_18310 [Colwellia sp. RSH04]